MKKIYIKPETLVVAVNVKENLMELSYHPKESAEKRIISNAGHGLAREAVRSEEEWEEW